MKIINVYDEQGLYTIISVEQIKFITRDLKNNKIIIYFNFDSDVQITYDKDYLQKISNFMLDNQEILDLHYPF